MKNTTLIIVLILAAAVAYFAFFRKKATTSPQPSSGAAPRVGAAPNASANAQGNSSLGTQVNQYSNDITTIGDIVQHTTGSSVGDWLGLSSQSQPQPPIDTGGTSGGDTAGAG